MKIDGHAAGGFIATKVLLRFLKPTTEKERRELLITGTIAGTIPDWDYFIYALSNMRFSMDNDFRHHTWITHTFLFHWIICAIIYIMGIIKVSDPMKKKAVAMGIGTTAHLIQDTIGTGDGIMLFYPISRKMYGIGLSGLHGQEWLEDYIRRPIYKIELGIIILAILGITLEIIRWINDKRKGA